MSVKKHGGLTKLATGIRGFDDITRGGLPQGRTTLIMGGPGTGKTIFALQSLVTGAQQGEPGVLVTFQESPRQIIEDAASFGWNLQEFEKDKLVILDARIRPSVLKSVDLYLSGMLAGVRLVAGEIGAKRIVFDAMDAALSLLGDRTVERHEIFRLRDWLLESHMTAYITAQVEGDDPFIAQRHGFMQFMADCVISLKHHASSPSAARALRVLKYRGSGFAEEEFPLAIGTEGLEVGCRPAKIQAISPVQAGVLLAEVKNERRQFQARMESLNRKAEIQKAEIDFLRQTGKKPKAATGKRTRAPRAQKSRTATLAQKKG